MISRRVAQSHLDCRATNLWTPGVGAGESVQFRTETAFVKSGNAARSHQVVDSCECALETVQAACRFDGYAGWSAGQSHRIFARGWRRLWQNERTSAAPMSQDKFLKLSIVYSLFHTIDSRGRIGQCAVMARTQDMMETLDLLRSNSLTSAVYGSIEAMILQGDLQPGQRVKESALAEKLAISRGPVREALRALEQVGLVKLVARRGVFVREMSHKQVLDVYDVRASLFGAAGQVLVETVTLGQLRELQTLMDEMEVVATSGNVESYYPLNLEFHDLLVTFSGNAELASIYQSQVKKMHLSRQRALVTRGGLDASVREHRIILRCLKQRDALAARKAMEAHVLAGKRRFLLASRNASGGTKKDNSNEN